MTDEQHYEYKFEDHSVLLRVLERPVFAPIVRALPLALTPNQLTIGGHLLVWFASAAVLMAERSGAVHLAGLAVACFLYDLSDCIDGMFARHTQRTSRLGELLDHGLDAVSLPLVPLCVGVALQQPDWIILSATAAVSFMNFATLMHGFRVGYVHLGTIGIVEGILVAALTCGVAAAIGVAPLAAPIFGSVSIAGWLLLSLVGGGLTALVSMRGLLRTPRDFVSLTLLFAAIVAWYATGRLSMTATGLLFAAVGSYHSCKITCARLLRQPLALVDVPLLALMFAGAGAALVLDLGEGAQVLAASGVIAYAFSRSAVLFLSTVKALQAARPRETAPP